MAIRSSRYSTQAVPVLGSHTRRLSIVRSKTVHRFSGSAAPAPTQPASGLLRRVGPQQDAAAVCTARCDHNIRKEEEEGRRNVWALHNEAEDAFAVKDEEAEADLERRDDTPAGAEADIRILASGEVEEHPTRQAGRMASAHTSRSAEAEADGRAHAVCGAEAGALGAVAVEGPRGGIQVEDAGAGAK